MGSVDVEHRSTWRTLRGRRSLVNPDSASHVWWLQEALSNEEQLALLPLEAKIAADVCIVGGGFTGLWAAIELVELDPTLRVVLIEKDECGFGASGRNGGWATGWHDEVADMVTHFGHGEAIRLIERSAWALGRIQAFSEEHGIDSRFRREGVLWGSSAKWQRGMWGGPTSAWNAEPDGSAWKELSKGELFERTGSPHLLNGAWQRDGASVQPANLVRGLRAAAVKLGVKIYEHTPLIELSRATPCQVNTPKGSIEADTVIIATGAWSAKFRELRRSFVPIASHIVATEPIPERLTSFSWARGAVLGDGNQMVHYAQVSADGRIIFGRGGGALGRFGRVETKHFDNPRTINEVVSDFRQWFPQYNDVQLTHGWGGAVDRSPGHLPFVGRFNCQANILFAAGYSGNGVGPSAYIGRILGRAALGINDEDTTGGMAQGVPAVFPHEPLRSVGGTILRETIRWAEGGNTPGTNNVPVHNLLGRTVKLNVPNLRKLTKPVLPQ